MQSKVRTYSTWWWLRLRCVKPSAQRYGWACRIRWAHSRPTVEFSDGIAED